ncbi:MAG: 50S ribosomal protein L9 [Prevotella sp.]|uniref:50S ribosomal protein L9 n=1 Tax=Prevotella sp. Rep29 TaxID=2691580 RepID=UPI001C6DF864|nr:50S ribosomal protein L9 [Prevotella sp. Rep29]MBQ3624212.1 50S ribosomal protein L9 [Prevotella sp.]MBR1656133.1 50S ribosomal protein L9 [Prevotella sp.]MBR3444509.1 50S ribosomal protein L9 [Prevotella sp.]MBR7013810.1 50S ribosomal protein L9 [Prevotella sp.]MBR7094404.1 50S ribosomal protein L9 [Prevotella sp.]
MEIILKEDIIGLGYKNDIVNVKNGYGRNYLIPAGKAVIATASAKKILAENLKQQVHKLERLKAEAEKKAEKLKDVAVEIAARVSSNDMLYGSVTAAMVADELEKKGVEVDRKIITMRDIKKIGTYDAVVHFHKEVEVKIPVTVIAENAAELAAEAAARKAEAAAKKNEEKQAEEAEATEEAAPEAEVEETPQAEEAPAAE